MTDHGENSQVRRMHGEHQVVFTGAHGEHQVVFTGAHYESVQQAVDVVTTSSTL